MPHPLPPTLAPSAPDSPAAPPTPTAPGPQQPPAFFDPHFELPDEPSGLVEPGAYDDYNPLPALTFPPLPFTLPPDDPLLQPPSASSSASHLAASSSLFFPSLSSHPYAPTPSQPHRPPESLFSFTESSALASFLTSSSDEPFLAAPGAAASSSSPSVLAPATLGGAGAAAGYGADGSFANLVRSRGAWDFNPRLPDFMPIFGRDEREPSHAGASAAGAGREETSRRLSGLSLSAARVATTSGRRSSSRDHPRSQPPAAPPRNPSLEHPPAHIVVQGRAKPRSSSSTTVADLLALDALSGRGTAGSVGGAFGLEYLRGQAMELAASTEVFESSPSGGRVRRLPEVAAVGSEEMAAWVDESALDDRGGGSRVGQKEGNDSDSTVHPSGAARQDEDAEMSHPSPPRAASVSNSAPVGGAHGTARRSRSPQKPSPAHSAPTRMSKRVRSNTAQSRSSGSRTRSPEVLTTGAAAAAAAAGGAGAGAPPAYKRRKESSPAKKPAAAVSEVKIEPRPAMAMVQVEIAQDEGEPELEVDELEEAEAEEKKGPKPLLTAEQKRTNHILSEQKRRNAIRTGYAELSHLLALSPSVPYPPFSPSSPPSSNSSRSRASATNAAGGGRGGSKSSMLGRAAGLCRWLEEGNAGLEAECWRLEGLVARERE